MKDYAEINCSWCSKLFKPFSKATKCCSYECRLEFLNNKKVKAPSNINLARYDIFQRDGFSCGYCGKTPFEDGIKLNEQIMESVYKAYGSKGDYEWQKRVAMDNIFNYGEHLEFIPNPRPYQETSDDCSGNLFKKRD